MSPAPATTGSHGSSKTIGPRSTWTPFALGLGFTAEDRSEAVLGHPGLGMPQDRIEALETILETACGILDGAGVPAAEEQDLPLRAATYGGEEEATIIVVDDLDLGNGRIQGSLF